MPEREKWQVGYVNDLKDTDPWFLDEQAAIEHAMSMHRGSGTNGYGCLPVGVWDERSTWVWLFFDGEQFRRV